MTKKDHEKIAGILYFLKLREDSGETGQARETCHDMANMLANDNPHFNKELFLKACGIES